MLLTECESKTAIFGEMFEDLQCLLRTTQPSTSAPNRIYTGGKSEGCSKVSSQTHWAIPRGPQLAHSPLVGMGLRVTASTLYGPSYAPLRWGQFVVENTGGIQDGKEKPPTPWIDGV